VIDRLLPVTDLPVGHRPHIFLKAHGFRFEKGLHKVPVLYKIVKTPSGDGGGHLVLPTAKYFPCCVRKFP
jgi:hypothetical protein